MMTVKVTAPALVLDERASRRQSGSAAASL
jgi:hypothetical protein